MYALQDFRYWNLPWALDSGDVTDLRRSRAIILDASSTGRYGPFEVGQYRELGGVRLQIIGRSREARSFTTTPIAFLDYQIAQELIPTELRNRTTYILVKLKPGVDRAAAQAKLKELLPFNSVLTREDWSSRSKRYWLTRTGLGMSMGLTVFLGCLVGVVIVGQTLYTSTLEHTREFGTVKAIGGTNASICLIVAQQAAVAAVVGYVLGVSISVVARSIMTHFGLKLILPPTRSAGSSWGRWRSACWPRCSPSAGWPRSTRPWSSANDRRTRRSSRRCEARRAPPSPSTWIDLKGPGS